MCINCECLFQIENNGIIVIYTENREAFLNHIECVLTSKK